MIGKSIEEKFQEIINQIFTKKSSTKLPRQLPKRIAVAVSGGIDSMALLLLIKNIFGQKVKIFCLTVDHNLRENSSLDAKFVADFCQSNFARNSLSCAVLKSNLQSPPEVDIENCLRQMRYQLLTDFCHQNKIKNLFVAHHNGDLAENFLIRLFRGSGIDGLSAMSPVSQINKINIIRPLLDFSKEELRQYLQSLQVTWVEDETNLDEKFLRNKIRNFLQTLPDSKAINSRVALASRAILEAKQIIEKETKRNFHKIFSPIEKPQENGFLLDIKKFCALEKTTATRYLGLSLMRISGRVYKPRLKKLERIYQLILDGKLIKEEFYGCTLRTCPKSFPAGQLRLISSGSVLTYPKVRLRSDPLKSTTSASAGKDFGQVLKKLNNEKITISDATKL